ncbi:9784_t:CDS:2 [Ambispora leptoticha]|uniref:9784_t:CDS:1 n=1 Tax=Ambispora leptoticha TaxID=144679 RepID=A0A9N9CQ87_9GLOM|nr:9784_t:CDS:2 [Ambispora leptoticha]
MDHPSKKSILADVKKDNALEKYSSKVIDIVRVLENEVVSNLSTINARNKFKNKLQHTEKTDPTGSLIDNYSIIEGRDSEDWMLVQ